MATINNILGVIPAPVAAVLMLGGFIFYALGCIRLGYGAAVKGTVLDLIEQAEHEIQGTKRGAERKAWVVKMLRMAISSSKWGRLISWAITDETIGTVIQFFFDRAKAARKRARAAPVTHFIADSRQNDCTRCAKKYPPFLLPLSI